MIKAVIFDCFGVLAVDGWKDFRNNLPEQVLIKVKEVHHDYEIGKIDYKDFSTSVQHITGCTKEFLDKVFVNTSTIKNEKLLSYISSIKQHYKIGLLSNVANNWIREVFLTDSEQGLFDDMVFSYELGITKPNPEIFSISCSRLSVGLEEAILVDDLKSYCQAARDIGMKTITYTDFSNFESKMKVLLS